MAALRGVLLDIDGTLLDSNDAHAQSWVETFEEFGHTVRFEDVRRLIGMGGDRLLPKLTGIEEESEIGQRISKHRRSRFLRSHLPSLRPFPKVRELLKELCNRNLVLVIATSAGPQELEPLLQQAQIADLIDEKTSSGDAEESKPAPDIVEAAVKRSGFRPAELVMIGDTPYDMTAAKRAGVRCIAVRSGGWDDAALADAVAIYADVADLLEHLEESPLAGT
ncbi:MAG TPA: HAD family hydrolase [Polyangiaceae bacterium]|nr:HAD family hydrolase [Polyangiaceae bacterium]